MLAPTITRDEGWSLTSITAAFSGASLVTGLVGIPVGRVVQRRGPRGVMVIDGAVGSAGLAGIGLAPSYAWFVAAILVCGGAAAGLFYAPAFAAITHWFGDRRVQALTGLTLVAAFASTIFAPLTTLLANQTSWRTTYLVLAAILRPRPCRFMPTPSITHGEPPSPGFTASPTEASSEAAGLS